MMKEARTRCRQSIPHASYVIRHTSPVPMSWGKFKYLWLTALVLIFCTPVGATTVMKIDADKLFAEADLVVAGKVVRLETKKIEGALTPIMTEAIVKIDSVLKGEEAREVAVLIPGGDSGEIGLLVPGAPVLEMGDHVLLALEKDKSERYRIRGFFQGRFSLIANGEPGKLIAVQDPFKRVVKSLKGCEKERAECVEAYPVKFTLDEIRQLIGKKP